MTAVALTVLCAAARVIVCQAKHAKHDQEAKKEAGKDIKRRWWPYGGNYIMENETAETEKMLDAASDAPSVVHEGGHDHMGLTNF